MQGTVKTSQAQFLVRLVAPVVVQRQVPGMGTVEIAVVVPQLQFIVDISVVAQRKPLVSLFIAVIMQRQAPTVWVSTLCRKL